MTPVSSARALCWEFYRLARRPVLMVTLAGCSLAGLYSIALEPFGARRDALVFSTLFVTLLIVHGLTLLNCRSEGLALGFERRLYRLPVSTTGLVVWRMLPAVLAGVLMYLATAGFMMLVFEVRWPLVGPALVVTTFLVWALALNWSLGRRPYLLAPVGLPLAVALFAWLKPRFEPRHTDVLEGWRDFGVRETGFLVLCSLLAVIVAVVGVRLDRAEPRRLQSLLTRGSLPPADNRETRRTENAQRQLPGFTSATRAQLWMEWREKGRFMAVWSMFALFVNVLAGGFPEFGTGPMLRTGLIVMAFILFLTPALAGFLHGKSDLKSRGTTLDRLRATRPMSDRQLASTLLQATFITTVTTWLSAFLGLATVTLGVFLWGDSEHVLEVLEGLRQALAHSTPFDVVLASALLLAWGVAASGTMLSLVVSGRNWLAEALAAPYILVALGLIIERATGFDAWRSALSYLLVVLVAALPIVTSTCAWLCHRKGHYTLRPLIRGALVYLSLATILLLRFPFLRQALSIHDVPLERAIGLAAPAALSGAFLPFVLAPLMVSLNRHR